MNWKVWDIYLKNQIGKHTTMLVEQVKENISYGKSQHFTKIQITNSIKTGEIVDCVITGIKQDVLSAQMI